MVDGRPDVILRVNQLSKKYGRLDAVRRASFSVRRGEVLGLIGPNGSGKTTLFGCLGGVLPYDSGSFETFSHPGTPAIFYVPDAVTPWADQSVRWAMDFCHRYFRATQALPPEWAARLGLEALLEKKIGTLSKGQRKRVTLAIGLIAPHPILLLDEPFDGLDLRQTREVAWLLRSVAATGRTLFLSIHQITDASRVCDRFVLLSGGEVRAEGTFEELAGIVPVTCASSLEDVFLALT